MTSRRASKRTTEPKVTAPKGYVTLGIPSGNAEAHTMRTLMDLTMWDREYGRRHLNPERPTLWVIGSSMVTNARNTLVQKFLDQPEPRSDWLLFLDDDQLYPKELLELLIESADPVERRIVGLPVWRFYSPEGDEGASVAVTHNVLDITDNGRMVPWPHELPENAVMQVGGVGTGCMMVHRSVFEEMRQASIDAGQGTRWCWFRQIIYQPADLCEGEDLYFCRLAWTLGIPVWVNTSTVLEHVKNVRLTRAEAPGVVVI